MKRNLLESGMDTFIRNNQLIPIVRKVRARGERSFNTIISPNDPFGFDVRKPGTMLREKPDFSLKPDSKHNVLFYLLPV